MNKAYHDLKQKLVAPDIDNPALEARILLKELAGFEDVDFFSDRTINKTDQASIDQAIFRRIQGEPLSKILGIKEFYGRKFYVSKDTLDPRPDSEILIDAVLEWFQQKKPNPSIRILDLGTGSGCLVLTLLAELPHATAVAVDLSSLALEMAKKNACHLNVNDRCDFRLSDWFDKLGTQERFDVIVANPPYIALDVIPFLSVAVQKFDPILALDGGQTGLDAYTNLLKEIKNYLVPDGFCFFEIGFDQALDVTRLIEKSGGHAVRIYSDLGGQDRVVKFHYGDK
jgi:release factor glutamine methyltransferase